MKRLTRKTYLVLGLAALLALIPLSVAPPAPLPTTLDILSAIRDVEHRLWSNADSVKNETKDIEAKLDNSTIGLEAIKNEIGALEANVTQINASLADKPSIRFVVNSTLMSNTTTVVRFSLSSSQPYQVKAVYIVVRAQFGNAIDLGTQTFKVRLPQEAPFFDIPLVTGTFDPTSCLNTICGFEALSKNGFAIYPALPASTDFRVDITATPPGLGDPILGVIVIRVVLETAQEAEVSTTLTAA